MTLPPGVRGQLVDVDGLALRVYDSGSGDACVVFEAGASGTLDSFNLVRERIEDRVRVIGYDRPGLGFSDLNAAATDRRPAAVAARLARLLDSLDVRAPVIVVGHSLGGLYARAFAASYPGRVAAMVLVDPSHERMWSVQSKLVRRLIGAQVRVMSGLFRMLAGLSGLGAGPLLARLMPGKLIDGLHLPAAEARALRRSYTSPTALRAIALEFRQLDACLADAAGFAATPQIPLTVLSAGRGRMDPEKAGINRFINPLHADLVAGHEVGRHSVVPDSGHYMPWDAPQEIADAIVELLPAATGER